VTTWTRDAIGQLRQLDDPSLGTRTFAHDVPSRSVTETLPDGRNLVSVFDHSGRLVHRADSSDPTATFDYHYDEGLAGAGHLTSISNTVTGASCRDDHIYEVSYTRAGPVANTECFQGNQQSVGTTYDNAGRVAVVTYPNGETVNYSYTPTGYLASVSSTMSGSAGKTTSYVTQIGYDPTGAPASRVLGNGLVEALERSPTRRLSASTLKTTPSTGPPQTVLSRQYSYYANGDVNTVHAEQLEATHYTYDSMDRLRSMSTPGHFFSSSAIWKYDNGGRLFQSDSWSASTLFNWNFHATVMNDYGDSTEICGVYACESNYSVKEIDTTFQGTLLSSQRYRYDDNGNAKIAGDYAFAWTADGALQAIDGPATPANGSTNSPSPRARWGYSYDGLGNIVHVRFASDMVPGEISHSNLSRNSSGSLLTTKIVASAPSGISLTTWENRIYAGNVLVAIHSWSEKSGVDSSDLVSFLHVDRQGTPIATSDAQGVVTKMQSAGQSGQGTGQTRDGWPTFAAGTALPGGFIQFGARVYDPRSTRFLTPDTEVPGAKAIGADRYGFAYDNPIKYSDPSGHVPISSDDSDTNTNYVENSTSTGSTQPDPYSVGPYLLKYLPSDRELVSTRDCTGCDSAGASTIPIAVGLALSSSEYTTALEELAKRTGARLVQNEGAWYLARQFVKGFLADLPGATVAVGLVWPTDPGDEPHMPVAQGDASGGDAGSAMVPWRWSPDAGFIGETYPQTLLSGNIVDRYGADTGFYFTPSGTSPSKLSLRSPDVGTPSTYVVDQPWTVEGGIAGPWFGQGGGGVQYLSPRSARDLVDAGVLRSVPR